MSLKFCVIIESNSQRTFFKKTIVLYTKMAAVTSRENRELNSIVNIQNQLIHMSENTL